MTEGPLPRVVFACDPGIVNPWCITRYDTNPNTIDTRQEARQVINLTRKQYNTEIGLTYFNKTLNRKKDQERYQDALIRLSRNSLKGVFIQDFDVRYLETRAGYEVLKQLYSSRNFGKLRFWLHSQKQKFDRVYVNKALRIFEEEAGGNDYVVAYGDGQFPLTMKGCGSSAHGRLMRLLSKRVRVVMTNEYRTTKACPKCRDKTSSMRQPKGSYWEETADGILYRVNVHGLSCCRICKTQWARDYAASLNIGRSFVHHFETGRPAEYLSR